MIRFATSQDASLIVDLIRGLADYERASAAVEVTAEQLREQMERPHPPFECLIAEIVTEQDVAKAVGFALFFRNYSTWRGVPGLYLEDLFVLEEYRGRGIGTALLDRLQAIVVERGWGRMEWAVLNWNTQAQGFYRQMGAHPMSEWTTWRLERPTAKVRQ